MKITRIARSSRRERVRIHVDGHEQPRLELAVDLLLRAGLAVGDLLSAERVAELERADELVRAREAALSLLAHRARSAVELGRRLERKDVRPAVLEATMGWLEDRGYLDDGAFAEAFVRDRLRLRPRGRAGLIRELRLKGVPDDVAAAATDRVLAAESVDEVELAREAASAWARRNASVVRSAQRPHERTSARRRLYGHLARRGFGPDAIRAAIAAALGD
jgi:regulatory protein